MKNKLFIVLSAALSVTSLAGCSTSPTLSNVEKDVAYGEYVDEQKLSSLDKINSFNFTGWKSLTDRHLILTVSRKRDFLVQLRAPCRGLEFAYSLKLNQFSSSTFDKKGDSISVVSSNDHIGTKCRAKAIYAVTKEQTKFLKAIGKEQPEQS